MAIKHGVLSPVPPRISQALDTWSEAVEPTLDIRGCQVTDQDFSEVKMLTVDDCIVENGSMFGVKFEKLEITDVQFKRLAGPGMQGYKASFLRTQFVDCRLTGADFPEALFEDCTFKNVKFDEAGLRFARFKCVKFEGCILARTDFSHAKFLNVTFEGCELSEANFEGAECKSVGLGNENIANCKGILGLKGSTISDEQLIQIAPLLASELGFKIQ